MSDDINILSAIRQIASERKIDQDEILEAIKEAIKIGYRNEYKLDEKELLEVEIDPESGHIAVYAEKKVVKKVEDTRAEISLSEAKELDDSVEEGDSVMVDITPEGDFGRIVAQTARQVILQKLRESEKESAINEIKERIGGVDNVTVQRVLPDGAILCDYNRAKAIMPKEERVPTEYYRIGERIKVYLMGIEEDAKGKFVKVSRNSPDFLKALFALEVPEVEAGTVEIVAIAREAGSRSKVAVTTSSEGIDPIGSCIGPRGLRINAITDQLKMGNQEETIDVILWDEDPEVFLMNAIRPAEAIRVVLWEKDPEEFVKLVGESAKELKKSDKKIAAIVVPADQQSLAIGRAGQNVRLAYKLTDWEIDVVGVDEDGNVVEAPAIEKPEEDDENEEEKDSTTDDDKSAEAEENNEEKE